MYLLRIIICADCTPNGLTDSAQNRNRKLSAKSVSEREPLEISAHSQTERKQTHKISKMVDDEKVFHYSLE